MPVPPAIAVRPLTPDEPAIDDYVAIRNAVLPEDPESAESVTWACRTYPATFLLIASLDGRPVGAATTGRIYVHPPAYERYWLSIQVLEAERGCGVGSALLAAASGIARRDGKAGFEGAVWETHPEALRFLEHRGFVETGRSRTVSLEVPPRPPAAVPPEGIRLVSLAARPDLVERLYDVALEAFPDIPTGGEPVHPGSMEEFRGDLLRPGATLGGSMIALDPDEAAIGYTHLRLVPGSTTVAWHEMTAVLPAWRGRGIATALKAASIAAAAAEGIERLTTMNDETNASMRAVNRRLGYQPAPDLIDMAGPLAD